jgi:3-methylcrotonyl-CoA carboxylase alpha subunit
VAAGEPLPLTQAQVPLHGHAIEVRLYAEDTDQGFLPASGTLQLYREPAAGPGRRVDSGVEEGDEVSPFYDPLLAKLIAWGDSREQARKRLLAMLEDTAVGGFATNLAFLRRLIAHPAFAAAELDTGFIERHQATLLPAPNELPEAFWTLAGQAWLATLPAAADATSLWASRQGWRLGGPPRMALRLACRGEVRNLTLVNPVAVELSGDRLHWQADGIRQSARLHRRGQTLFLEWQDRLEAVTWADPLAEVARQADAGGLTAPMNASVVAVSVAVGDVVEAGAPLVVLEAMKMEHSIRAPRAGVVAALFCSPGELVAEGAPLVELEESPS